MKLPTRLGKEPLIEAVFEVRFESTIDASDILPGLLHVALPGEKRIERLPINELPKSLRDQDLQLSVQPLVRIFWNGFYIMVGERSLAISCTLPYPGWGKFNEAIVQALGHLRDSRIVTAITRYSMKYVDMIEGQNLGANIDRVELSVQVGRHALKKEQFQLKVRIEQDDMFHIIDLGAPAHAKMHTGDVREGLLVAIDSIVEGRMPLTQYMNGVEGRLKKLHTANKAMFFECLKPATIDYLEPTYD
ncbi:TIGR04255 family protein [Caenimonas terrae]|uniref:TIGR04255 family protein n=1 Tax=Caenimonas terrae TaxID=696074 RepID=A0ABW0NDU1_9BURK